MSAPDNPMMPDLYRIGEWFGNLAKKDLSLRDYFAAQALNGMVGRGVDDNEAATDCARKAYLIADAMLAERAKS